MDQGNEINDKTISNNYATKSECMEDKILVSTKQREYPLEEMIGDQTKAAPFISSSNNKVMHCSDNENGKQQCLITSESKSPSGHIKISVNEEENMVLQKQQYSSSNDVKSFTVSNKYKTKSRKSEFPLFLIFY